MSSTARPARITKADIEAKLRRLQGDVEDTVTSNRQKIITAVAVAAALTVTVAYLLGRRAGRKRSAIVEIRRY